LLILTSWDDGHPSDLRLAEVLSRFGLKGTFFVPLKNCEGRPVLSPAQLRHVALEFEIGGHTLDHIYLDRIGETEAHRQVVECRQRLEDIASMPVHGFCYPGGRVTEAALSAVKAAGFKYARTIENLRFDAGSDNYRMPTTIQLFPHPKRVYYVNYLRYGAYSARWSAFRSVLNAQRFQERLRNLAMECVHSGGVFHLWGHSWELDEFELWDELESFLAFLTSLPHEVGSLNDCYC
jgi:peptidoglycan/xylan/chitin deacetylase (PgdA/CDA1 family)